MISPVENHHMNLLKDPNEGPCIEIKTSTLKSISANIHTATDSTQVEE